MNIGNWDTICTIDADYINQQLTHNLDQLIQTFAYTGKDPFAGDYTISGQLGPWQLVAGGSNTLVHVEIPIASGLVTAGDSRTNIGGMSVVVEISLKLLPSQTLTNVSHLCFDFAEIGSTPGDATPGLVTPLSFSDPDDTGKGSLVMNAVAEVLVANASSVSFVFASIGLVDPATPSWLTPVRSTYDYSQPLGQTSGYMAILSVTRDVDISGWDTQIDPGLLSGTYPLTLAISQPLFLQNVVMPLLPSALPNTDPATFRYSNGSITNTRSFPTPGVQKGAITYHPEVSFFGVSATDNYLVVSARGSCDLDMPNASTDFSVTAKNVLSYDGSSNALTFQPDPNPQTSHSNNVPWYDYALIALSGGIALAIFASVIPMIASEISSSLNSGASGINLAQSPPVTVTWPGMETIAVKNAGLNDLLFLQGVPA